MNEISLAEYRQQIMDAIDDGRYTEAVADGRHILQHYPKDVHAYWLLGRAMFEAGQDEHAADMFRRVLSVDPDRMLAWVGLSELAERQSDLDAAIRYLERAFELATDNDGIAGHLRHLYDEWEGHDPKRLQLTGGALARLYLRGDLLSRAIAELRGLLEEHPDRVDLRMTLAEALWRRGDRMQAAQACQEILGLQPFNLTANLILGEIWASDGRAEGKRYLERAEELDPENEAAQELFGPSSPLPPRDPQITPADYHATVEPTDLSEIEMLPQGLEDALIPPEETLNWAIGVPVGLQEIAEDADGDAIAREMDGTELPADDMMDDTSPLLGDRADFEQQERSVSDDTGQEGPRRLSDLDQEELIAPPHESVTTGEEDADDLEPADIPDWLQGLVPVEQTPRPVPGTGALTTLLDEETTEAEFARRDEFEETDDLMALLEAEGLTAESDVLHWLEQLTDDDEADLSLPAAEEGHGRVPETAPDSEGPVDNLQTAHDGREEAGQRTSESPELSAKPTEAMEVAQPEQDDAGTVLPDWLESETRRGPEDEPTRADTRGEDAIARVEEWGVDDDLPGWLDDEELPYESDVLAWLKQLSEDVEEELRREVQAPAAPPAKEMVEQRGPTADALVADVADELHEEMDAEGEPRAEEIVHEPEPSLDAAVLDAEGELGGQFGEPLDDFVEQPEATVDTVVADVAEELQEEMETQVEPPADEIVHEPEPSLDAAIAGLEEELQREVRVPSEQIVEEPGPPLDVMVEELEEELRRETEAPAEPAKPTTDVVCAEEEREPGKEVEAGTERPVEEIVAEPDPTLDPTVVDVAGELGGEFEAPSGEALDDFVEQPEATVDTVVADVDEELHEAAEEEVDARAAEIVDDLAPAPDAAVPDLDEDFQEELEPEAEAWAQEIVADPESPLDTAIADLDEDPGVQLEAPPEPPADEYVEQPEPTADALVADVGEELQEKVEAEEACVAAATEPAGIASPPSFKQPPPEDLPGLIVDQRAYLEGHLDDNQARLKLGRLLWQAEDRDGAIEAYDTLIQHSEPLDEIISDLEQYTERWSDPWLKRALGDAYFRADRLQDALDVYRQALADL